MSLTIANASQRIGRQMEETEMLIDQSAMSTAALCSDIVLVAGTFRSHEAAKHAHPALLRAHKAMGCIAQARSELARAHAALHDAYRITMSPAEDECPEWKKVGLAQQSSAAG